MVLGKTIAIIKHKKQKRDEHSKYNFLGIIRFECG